VAVIGRNGVRWPGRAGERPARPQMQRQAFLLARFGAAQAALLKPPQPLCLRPPLVAINRRWHPRPRLRELVMCPSRTQATNAIKNVCGVRLRRRGRDGRLRKAGL